MVSCAVGLIPNFINVRSLIQSWYNFFIRVNWGYGVIFSFVQKFRTVTYFNDKLRCISRFVLIFLHQHIRQATSLASIQLFRNFQ
jgi:hypothetical protein